MFCKCFRKSNSQIEILETHIQQLTSQLDRLQKDFESRLQFYQRQCYDDFIEHFDETFHQILKKDIDSIRRQYHSRLTTEIQNIEYIIQTGASQRVVEILTARQDSFFRQMENEYQRQMSESMSRLPNPFVQNNIPISSNTQDSTIEIRNIPVSLRAQDIKIPSSYIPISSSIQDVPSGRLVLEDASRSVNIQIEDIVLSEEIVSNDKIISNPERYKSYFHEEDREFWGIGIENETYLELSSIPNISLSDITNRLGRERYSVNYFKHYELHRYRSQMKSTRIGRLINSHSLTKMDRHGNHLTTYEKTPQPNLLFTGKTVLQEWYEYAPAMKKVFIVDDKTSTNIFVDGDTIEFITEDFYKSDILKIVKELRRRKQWFLQRFQEFRKATNLWLDLGDVKYVREHSGLAEMMSQRNTYVPFNNTTYHFHITLPTSIQNGVIENWQDFENRHSRAILWIQWFEPFLIATLGAPDWMSHNGKYAKGSMRGAMSRYIGVGTYNPHQMEKGKLLTVPIETVRPNGVVWWRDRLETDLEYRFEDKEIGLDFNWNKYYQSGFEFRMMDGFPEEYLSDVLYVILLICEWGIDKNIQRACETQIWNDLVYKTIVEGYEALMSEDEQDRLNKMFSVNVRIEGDVSLEIYFWRVVQWIRINITNTSILEKMVPKEYRFVAWDNFNRRQHQSFEHL